LGRRFSEANERGSHLAALDPAEEALDLLGGGEATRTTFIPGLPVEEAADMVGLSRSDAYEQ
jgi:hypothetical protein